MTSVIVDGLKYEIIEKGNGVPVLLLHGFTGSGENWRDLMERLSGHYRMIAIDLPGHGQTDSPNDISRYRIERVSDDLIQILGHLNASPVHWLGYSMGGRLALFAALHFPESFRSLTLVSATAGLIDAMERGARRQQDNSLADYIENEGVGAFVDYWERLPMFASQISLASDARKALREQRLTNSSRGLANSLRGMGTGEQPSLWAILCQLRVPTHLVAGQLDEKFAGINSRMADAIPDCRLSIVAQAGHAVQVERPTAFAELVANFLDDRSKINGEDLPGSEEDDKSKRSQRHLL